LSLPLAFSQLERSRIWQLALWPMRNLAIRYRCSSLFLCLVAFYSLGQTERTGFCHRESGSEVGRFDQATLQTSRSAIDSETAFTLAGILRSAPQRQNYLNRNMCARPVLFLAAFGYLSSGFSKSFAMICSRSESVRCLPTRNSINRKPQTCLSTAASGTFQQLALEQTYRFIQLAA